MSRRKQNRLVSCIIAVSLVAAGPFLLGVIAHADAQSLPKDEFGGANLPQGNDIIASAAPISRWKGCPAGEMNRPPPNLCLQLERQSKTPMLWVIRDLLGHEIIHAGSICVVDAAVVELDRDCASKGYNKKYKYSDLNSVMVLLARRWAQRGVLERSDQWFERAYSLASIDDDPKGFLEINVLRKWTLIKLQQGDLKRAHELAERHTATARAVIARFPVFMGLLVEARQLEAEILDQIGRTEEAMAARHEAEVLSRIPICDVATCVRASPAPPE